MTREEQETSINMIVADTHADIYTSDPVMIRRMDRLVTEHPDVFEMVRQDEVGKTYRCPKKCVRVSPPRVGRTLTDEQRQAAAERLRKAREARSGTAHSTDNPS